MILFKFKVIIYKFMTKVVMIFTNLGENMYIGMLIMK